MTSIKADSLQTFAMLSSKSRRRKGTKRPSILSTVNFLIDRAGGVQTRPLARLPTTHHPKSFPRSKLAIGIVFFIGFLIQS
ncbi:unnamed protein product, partial [Citrullus colocynthis]